MLGSRKVERVKAAVLHGAPACIPPGLVVLAVAAIIMLAIAAFATPARADDKVVVPTLEKEVGRAGGDDAVDFGKDVDAPSGTPLTYRLVATLPSNYMKFRTYRYAFEDRPSEALGVDESSVRVRLEHADGSSEDVTEAFETSLSDGLLRIACEDLRAAVPDAAYGDRIEASYEASIDAGLARTGFDEGNANEATLEYALSPDGEGLGRTVPSAAVAYTYRLRIEKRSKSGDAPLAGARFTVRREDGRYLSPAGAWVDDPEDAAVATGEDGAAEFGTLGTGSYVLSETEAPTGYARARDVTLTVGADLGEGVLTLGSDSEEAQVSLVDAGSGVATLVVHDASLADSGGGSLPRTGDWTLVPQVAAAGCATVAVALAIRAWRGGRAGRTDEGDGGA